MELSASAVIARNDLRILRRDSIPFVLLIVMPLVVVLFLKPAFRPVLVADGNAGATGAEHAVPAMQVMFGFYLVSQVSFGFFREHAWRTWDRLRASPATTGEILLGKMGVPVLEAVVQFAVIFGVGAALIDLHVEGSWLQLIVVGAAFSICLVTMGLAVTAICRTVMQVNAITNIAALMLSGLGGALVPESVLPGWAKFVSPVVPSHWAMHGYQHAILGKGDGIAVPVVVLLGFAAVFAAVAARGLRFEERKTGFV